MKKLLIAILASIFAIGIAQQLVFADPPLPLPRMPVGGDQDGSETPFVLGAQGFELDKDVKTFRIPGAGAKDLIFDFVYRGASYNNEFGFFRVDDAAGKIGNLNPGDPGYVAAALAPERAVVVFPSRSDAYTPDMTKSVSGGDILVFFIVQNNTLANFRANNPTNDLNKLPIAFFSMDPINPDNFDHFVGFRNATLNITQFGFEDMTDGGDKDYDDIVYNVKVTLQPSPVVETRDIVFITGIDSIGNCVGFRDWVPYYLSTPSGKALISGRVKIGNYYNFSYKDGSSYQCPLPTGSSPIYTASDTCDGIEKSAFELQQLINKRGTTNKVTIVAHSMGGVVTAFLVANLPVFAKKYIASVITFDSPHQGIDAIAAKAKGESGESACTWSIFHIDQSLIDLENSSDVIKKARKGALQGVPFYTLNATQKDLLGVEFVPRNQVVLNGAKPFSSVNWCGSEQNSASCEPPRAILDDHSSSWMCRFDATTKDCMPDINISTRQDKAKLVACAVIGAEGCFDTELKYLAGATNQIQVPVDPGVTRLQIVNSFAGIVSAAVVQSPFSPEIRLVLNSPDGTIYGPNGTGPVAAYAVDGVSEIYEMVNPAPGTWIINLLGTNVPPDGLDVTLGMNVLEREHPDQVLPIAYSGEVYTGTVGESITFSGAGSWDPDGEIVKFEWDFESDGIYDFSSADLTASHIYLAEFAGKVTLRVTDNKGGTASAIVPVEVKLSKPGDCNNDRVITASDVTALALEFFDGDDNGNPLATAGGSYAGSPACDANEDNRIGASDVTCIARLFFNGPGACRAGVTTAAATNPSLTLPNQLPAVAGGQVTVPITLNSHDTAVGSLLFALDYDESWLHFDPADNDGNGIPDAVTFNLPAEFVTTVTFDPGAAGGELDFTIANFAATPVALPDGALATVTLTTGQPPVATTAAIGFAQTPAASFGHLAGTELSGTTADGSVVIGVQPPNPLPNHTIYLPLISERQ